ncbi:MAG: hypothetical protein B7Y26_07315 [Hydrogenophilales bacterium 16-64-46]|nr:MAG: hypothetical protein B7Z32_07250 [Hydrogenophilales bacterium 12-64-13]OYZ05560.1 MAG: hypothetical protein B7Y26_07315 [Hydrogenophilales bacterium 16-64-46]OZA40141.1 MAG: hypothetical protein B7X87_00700 [Hydrogenophilales bacterium 17-64-34]
MDKHSHPLELDFSKLLGFDQLPGFVTDECQSAQTTPLPPARLQAKVGAKTIQTVLAAKIGGKVGIKV